MTRAATARTATLRVRSAQAWTAVGGIVALVAVLATPAAGSAAHPAAAAVVPWSATATFTTPPDKGSVMEPQSAHPLTLTHGYVEHEFFASGRASAFAAKAQPADGKWSVSRTTSAAYRTRIIVRRPPAKDFNGTVIVEWMNVTEAESSPDWDYLNPMLMRDGYAYVAVSEQALGVNGGTSIFGEKSPGLVGADPARYKTLHHPGDKYSLDMFAQIGLALQNSTTAASVLGGLHPQRIVATGESQSAYFLTAFADAIQPMTNAYDGIFIHSRGGAAAGFNGAISVAGDIRIRTDTRVPVFMFETQSDLIELGYAPAQQPDTRLIHTWEVAGTSHADTWIVGPYQSILGCKAPVNDGPQHDVIQAAFAAFKNWVARGTAPPTSPRFTLASTHPAVLALAADGDVRGGLRTPAVDVPIATLSNTAPAGSNEVCTLFGVHEGLHQGRAREALWHASSLPGDVRRQPQRRDQQGLPAEGRADRDAREGRSRPLLDTSRSTPIAGLSRPRQSACSTDPRA